MEIRPTAKSLVENKIVFNLSLNIVKEEKEHDIVVNVTYEYTPFMECEDVTWNIVEQDEDIVLSDSDNDELDDFISDYIRENIHSL